MKDRPARARTDRSSVSPPRFRTGTAKMRKEWDRLTDEIRRCQKCPLGAVRTQAVVYRGGLSPRVVFLGEAPGADEDRIGLPFVGRSGKMLDRAVIQLGLAEDEYGVLNTLKCRPPGNRYDRSAARTCRPYLDRQLDLLAPELVVPLGAHALRAIDPNAPRILLAAGRPRTEGWGPHFPLLHPAAALRSRRWRERWEQDLRALQNWLADPPS